MTKEENEQDSGGGAATATENDPLVSASQQQQQQPHQGGGTVYGGIQAFTGTENGNDNNDSDDDDDSADDVASFMSMQSGLTGTIVESVQDFIETATELMDDITDAFVEELQEADEEQDRFFFLEMGLTRNLSLMPGDLVDASHLVPDSNAPLPDPDAHPHDHDGHKHEEEEHLAMQTIEEGKILVVEADEALEEESSDEKAKLDASITTLHPEKESIPLSAYLLLGSAVVSLSSIGPLLDFQDGVSSTMKVYWRTLATSVALLPFATASIRREGGLPKLTFQQWSILTFTAAMYAFMCIFFVWALEMTAVGNAVIFSNSQSLLLLVGKLFVGAPISTTEGTGALVAFAGAILCSKDSAEADATAAGGRFGTVIGDLFALSSALCGVGYLVFAKIVRSTMDLYVFMFFVMFVGSLWTLVCVLLRGETVSFDMNNNHGVLGWLNFHADRLPLEVIMVVICNLFGAMGYVRAMHYFDNLVISVAALLEPVVAEVMAFCIGVGSLPHPMGWIGNILVVLGTIAVVYQPPSAGKDARSAHGAH